MSLSSHLSVVLMATQLGENIGMAARAMHNFGLHDLRLVQPREGWSRTRAIAAAAGGASLLDNVKIYPDLALALADFNYVLAASARIRDMNKPILSPDDAQTVLTSQNKIAILFGPERSGLDNEAIALCDALVKIPANEAFPSFNLAQAVLLLSYHFYRAYGDDALALPQSPAQSESLNQSLMKDQALLAPKKQLFALFAHLEEELDGRDFFRPQEKRPIMIRNLRNLFHRARLSLAEVKALRGVITSLTRKKKS